MEIRKLFKVNADLTATQYGIHINRTYPAKSRYVEMVRMADNIVQIMDGAIHISRHYPSKHNIHKNLTGVPHLGVVKK